MDKGTIVHSEKATDIAIISEVTIPATALMHPNAQTLNTCLSTRDMTSIVHKPVLGTTNTQQPELYGWNYGVGLHTDNNGFIYLLILNDSEGELYGEDYQRISFKQGDIVRINDRQPHAVLQRGFTIALFVGAFETPCDDQAIALLQTGLKTLCNAKNQTSDPQCHDLTLTNHYGLQA
jgi:hypothetical protein